MTLLYRVNGCPIPPMRLLLRVGIHFQVLWRRNAMAFLAVLVADLHLFSTIVRSLCLLCSGLLWMLLNLGVAAFLSRPRSPSLPVLDGYSAKDDQFAPARNALVELVLLSVVKTTTPGCGP